MNENFSIHIAGLRVNEVMQAQRRLVLQPYLILWLVVYLVVGLVYLIQRSVTFFTLFGPAIILVLLALAYEVSGRKSYKPLGYSEAVLDYDFTPEGFRLSVGGQSAEFLWENVFIRRTRSTLLLYTDKQNSSVLPLRCITPEQKDQLLRWAGKS